MYSPLDSMPDKWFADVIVLRGGRDDRGELLPDVEIPVKRCLIAARSTDEPIDRSDLTESTAVLYRKPGFTFRATDRIRVPDGARMSGTWSVAGRISEWPFGVEVPLRGV